MRTTSNRPLYCISLLSLLAACSDEPLENLNGDPPAAETPVDMDSDQATIQPPRACELNWRVDNILGCSVPPTLESPPLLYSSHLGGDGKAACDPYTTFPQPVPKGAWSTHHVIGLTTGSAHVCLALKRGNVKAPTSADCVLHEQCLDVDYATAGEPLELPPLAPWSATDAECVRAYYNDGGYLELRVESDELGCGDPGGDVSRLPLCPPRCAEASPAAGCEGCVDRPAVTGAF